MNRMHTAFFTALSLSVTASPLSAAAPAAPTVDVRVNKLEKEMRAVQRKVFPGASPEYFDPEIVPAEQNTPQAGQPATTPVADLGRRVDALERSLAQLTGQVEQSLYRMRQLEDQLSRFKGDSEFRLNTLEGKGAALPVVSVPVAAPIAKPAATTATPPTKTAAVAAAKPATTAATPASVPAAKPTAAAVAAVAPPATAIAASEDPAEAGYKAGYELWVAKKYPEAAAALNAMAAKYPKHKRASYARNLAGRAYLDNGQYNEAIRALFENTKFEDGERAPHSYYYMGQALMQRKPALPEKACQAYDVLVAKYPDKITGSLAELVTKGRADAKCR